MGGDEVTAWGDEQRLSGDCGANLVEYALLVSLIFLVALTAVQAFANNANKKLSCTASAISQQSGGVTC